jgi:heme O synthase-like polyprenyltransferase
MSSRKNSIARLIAGIFVLFGLHLLSLTLMGLLLGLASAIRLPIQEVIAIAFGTNIALIGITQLIYVIPFSIYLKRKNEDDLMKGVIVGAIITLLLNGGCWLMISNFH